MIAIHPKAWHIIPGKIYWSLLFHTSESFPGLANTLEIREPIREVMHFTTSCQALDFLVFSNLQYFSELFPSIPPSFICIHNMKGLMTTCCHELSGRRVLWNLGDKNSGGGHLRPEFQKPCRDKLSIFPIVLLPG